MAQEVPKIFQPDNGREITGKIFEELAELCRILVVHGWPNKNIYILRNNQKIKINLFESHER